MPMHPGQHTLNAQDAALLKLGHVLREVGYEFTTITPASHQRVTEKRFKGHGEGAPIARDARDVFGWNLPFASGVLPEHVLGLMHTAHVVDSREEACEEASEQEGEPVYTSRVRFSTLGDDLFVHSRFPTHERDAVFFGPDTYRFCRMLKDHAPRAGHAVDMGCGSGAGGLAIRDRITRLTLADVNDQALRFAAINSALAGCAHATVVASDCMASVDAACDLIVANPPYVIDPQSRTYCNGGGRYGVDLAQRMTEEALAKIAVGGTFMLYTGAPVVAGRDMFWEAVRDVVRNSALDVHYDVQYSEIDPDVFGEELDEPAYVDVERLCVVELVVRRKV